MRVPINRFLGHELTWRLLFAGHPVTLFNRGRETDTFGNRVERLRGDRTTADFDQLLRGRTFDAAVDFAAYTGDDARRAVSTLGGALGHYVVVSSGQVYLVRQGDSFYFNSTRLHGFRNPSHRRKAVVLWVITPPSF